MKSVKEESVNAEYARETGEEPICPVDAAREALLQYALEHRGPIMVRAVHATCAVRGDDVAV